MLMPRSLSRLSSKILRNSYFHGAGHKSVGSIFNQMKSRVLITIITLLFFLPAAFAQKRLIIETEKIIKSGKNLEKAEQNMRNLLRDSANRKNIKVWATLTDAMRGQYLASNENIYLQNRQDTAKLFLLARRMFLDYQGLDTIDATPDKKGRVRPSYRKSNAQFLDTYRPNLYNGGIYFIRKNNLQQAYTMLESYLDCLRQPLLRISISSRTRSTPRQPSGPCSAAISSTIRQWPSNTRTLPCRIPSGWRTACSIWPKSTRSNATNSSTSRPWWMVSSAIPTPPISSRGLLII